MVGIYVSVSKLETRCASVTVQQLKIMSRSRKWTLTLNNYTEEQRTALLDLPSLAYAIIGKETGENGTPHLQGYLKVSLRRIYLCLVQERELAGSTKEKDQEPMLRCPTSPRSCPRDRYPEQDLLLERRRLRREREIHSARRAYRPPRLVRSYAFRKDGLGTGGDVPECLGEILSGSGAFENTTENGKWEAGFDSLLPELNLEELAKGSTGEPR